jgi:hypothetical protein
MEFSFAIYAEFVLLFTNPHFTQGKNFQGSLGLYCDRDLGCRIERALDAAEIQVNPHDGRLTSNSRGGNRLPLGGTGEPP